MPAALPSDTRLPAAELAWQIALLGSIAVLLQQIAVPYVLVAEGQRIQASLLHAHAGWLLGLAMLVRDRRVLIGVWTMITVGWVLRSWGMGAALAREVPAGLAWTVAAYGWTWLCAHWMGWPRAAGEQRVGRRDLPIYASIGLLAYPLGLAALSVGLDVVFSGAPNAIDGLQMLFAKYFGVLVVTLPMLLAWTEWRHPVQPARALRTWRAWIWPVAMLLFLALAITLRNTQMDPAGPEPRIEVDYRFALAGLLAWGFLHLSPRIASLALPLGLGLLVTTMAQAAQSAHTGHGFLYMVALAFEAAVFCLGLAYIHVLNRDNLIANQALQRDARRDQATGLPNLHALRHDLEREPFGEGYQLGYLLLDQGDEWVAGYGLDAQVRVLRQTFAQIRDSVRAYLAGNGQYVLLLRGQDHDEALWDDLLRRLEGMAIEVQGQPMRLSPYLGIVALRQPGELPLDAALVAASQLAFDARRHNEMQPLREQPSQARSGERRQLMQQSGVALEAIRARRLELWFQRIVPAQEGENRGLEFGEVLCRLRAPDGRLIQPGEFLPAVEAAGRSAELDLAVVETLGRLLARHPGAAQKFRYAINLAGASLASSVFTAQCETLLRSLPIPLHLLCLEITESAVMSSPATATPFLERLRRKGCRIAIDDFGKGMQSFGRLKELPVDILKIDGSFVRAVIDDPQDRALVEASIGIARAFRAQTVAEYVEDERIADAVRGMGVDWMQGFLYSRPEPLEGVLVAASS